MTANTLAAETQSGGPFPLLAVCIKGVTVSRYVAVVTDI